MFSMAINMIIPILASWVKTQLEIYDKSEVLESQRRLARKWLD